jgi:hypothetical protein
MCLLGLGAVALSPQANYTGRGIRRLSANISPNIARRGGDALSAQLVLTAVNLGFLERSHYFVIQVAPQLSSRSYYF